MKQENKLNLNTYIKNSLQVKIYYFEDEIYGQILMQSTDFILIREIKDWHYDGYMILPKQYIANIGHTELEQFRAKILPPLSSTIYQTSINWLNLDSFDTILASLLKNYNEISVEGAANDVNQFMIGKLIEYNKNNIYIQQLNIYAEFLSEPIEIPLEDITCITFKDEYSLKLFEYNKKYN